DSRQERRPLRHARPDGDQDAGGHGPAARVPDRQADRTDQRRPARAQSGHALSRPAQAGAARVDFVQVGEIGERPPRENLRLDSRRAQAAREGGSAVAARREHRGALPEDSGGVLVTRLRVLLSRLRSLGRPGSGDRDLDDEIAGHLAEAADEYVRQGLSPEEAYRAARRDFGGVTQTKEVYREIRSFGWLEATGRDVRFAARML